MYISKKDFELIYESYFIMTGILADFDNLLTDEEDEQVIDGQRKLLEIMRKENIKKIIKKQAFLFTLSRFPVNLDKNKQKNKRKENKKW